MKNKISLHDHRLKDIYVDDGYIIDCSCGKSFKGYLEALDKFNNHQKEELNKQLQDQNIELEIV